MINKFERIVKFGMPFDKRTPNPSTNCGIGSMRIWFILKGEKGAVQIMLGTALYPQNVVLEKFNERNDYIAKQPTFTCWDVGYHAWQPIRDWQKEEVGKDCNLSPNGKCHYDGSSLRGEDDKIAEQFLEKGEDFIWNYLEDEYHRVFDIISKELDALSTDSALKENK